MLTPFLSSSVSFVSWEINRFRLGLPLKIPLMYLLMIPALLLSTAMMKIQPRSRGLRNPDQSLNAAR